MNVLSLFDGISCGQLAFQRANIPIEKYYASEICDYSIQIAKKNFSNIVEIGDIRNVSGINYQDIDIIIGGSPCTDLSASGRKKGLSTRENIEIESLNQYLQLKQQGFEFEGYSYLFWEYVRLLQEVPHKWFLLENVKMSKKWEEVFTNALGVQPTLINSSIFSAQRRPRLYWTNIPINELPPERDICLGDIFDPTLEHREIHIKHPETIKRCKTYYQFDQSLKGHNSQDQRYYDTTDKCNTLLVSSSSIPRVKIGDKIFLLKPEECEKLQTLPQGYTEGVPDSKRYAAIGNGWNVDTITHIFSGLSS